MGKNAFKWLITATVTVAFTTSAWAQTVDPGQIEFLSSCAPCHGAEGKGKGPMSAASPRTTVASSHSARCTRLLTVEKWSRLTAPVKCQFGEQSGQDCYIHLTSSLIIPTIQKLSPELAFSLLSIT